MGAALGVVPDTVSNALDAGAVPDSDLAVRAVQLDRVRVAVSDNTEIIITALGNDCDFFSGFFVLEAGTSADPMMGPVHHMLSVRWASRRGMTAIFVRQVSAGGRFLRCMKRGDRASIAEDGSPCLDGPVRR